VAVIDKGKPDLEIAVATPNPDSADVIAAEGIGLTQEALAEDAVTIPILAGAAIPDDNEVTARIRTH
jgi:hypothetical protein